MLDREIQTHERSSLLPNSSAGELRSSSVCGPLTYFCTGGSSDHEHTNYTGIQEGTLSPSHQHCYPLN